MTAPSVPDQPLPLQPSPLRKRRRRLFWILSACLVICGSLLIAIVLRRASSGQVPAAYALLHIEREQPHILSGPRAGADSDEDFESYRQNQMALPKTRAVLTAALRDRKVAQLPVVEAQRDPVRWLEDNL